MPKIATPLRDLQIAQAKPKAKDYRLFDGGGLFLLIKTTGVKNWRIKYKKPDGRDGLTALGDYPALSLAQARAKRDEMAAKLAAGIDPAAEKATAKTGGGVITFERLARDWWESQKKWSEHHAARVWRRFEQYVLPTLGNADITAIDTTQVVAVLTPIEVRGTHDVASRLRQYVVATFRFGVQRGLLKYNPAAELAGIASATKSTHRAALPLEELPELLRRINTTPARATTRLGLLLALHLLVRSSELRNARWSEFDFAAKLWTLPPEREAIEGARYSGRGAKMKTPHLIPLTDQVVATLQELRQHVGDSELLFPGDHRAWVPMSENTLGGAIRRMGYCTKTQVTLHGFRAMACGALNESGKFSRDAIERQMAHQERNSVRAAYIHKAQFLDERRRIMEWWSQYITAVSDGYIPPWEYG
jgi:integrase